MRSSMSDEELGSAMKLHDRLIDIAPPELHHGRLKLPCILFPVSSIDRDPISHRYTATVSLLGKVEITTKDDLYSARNMFFANPWFKCLMDPGVPLSETARRESALKLLAALR